MCRWRGRSRSEEASPEEAGLRLALLFCGRFFNAPDVRLFLRRDGRGQRSLEHEPQVSLQFHARLLWARNLPAGRQQYGVEMASKNGGGGSANRPTFTDQEALLFHSQGRPGKLEVVATKPM